MLPSLSALIRGTSTGLSSSHPDGWCSGYVVVHGAAGVMQVVDAGAGANHCLTFLFQLCRDSLLPTGHQQCLDKCCIGQLSASQECHLVGVHPWLSLKQMLVYKCLYTNGSAMRDKWLSQVCFGLVLLHYGNYFGSDCWSEFSARRLVVMSEYPYQV